MNSDPHESAAWRAFGMLDADEAAAFDEAMRHDPVLKNAYREMENFTAAVAAATTAPIAPRHGQLESLHLRLGIGDPPRKNWLGISGWAAAAALTAILALQNRPVEKLEVVREIKAIPAAEISQAVPPEKIQTADVAEESTDGTPLADNEAVDENPHPISPILETPPPLVRVETKRLIQEIEVLREKLENFQERDRERFTAVPGMAWPIVMRMSPPRKDGDALVVENDAPALTAMLGDALTAASASDETTVANTAKTSQQSDIASVEPSAIPIYDPARGDGTIYVSNLPETTEDEPYRLWVKTKKGKQPVYVGRLPNSNGRKSESFDFSLGATATVPAGFILTKDPKGPAQSPNAANTILQGPSLK